MDICYNIEDMLFLLLLKISKKNNAMIKAMTLKQINLKRDGFSENRKFREFLW